MDISIYNFPKKFWPYFSKKRGKQIFVAIFLMVLSSLAELISTASVFPFLYVVTSDPELLWENDLIRNLFKLIWINDPNKTLIPITLIFILAAIGSGVIKTTFLWFNARLSGSIGSDLSTEIYKRVLNQSYSYHINTNSSKVIASIGQQLNRTTKAIQSYLDLIGSGLTNLALIYGLLVINWVIALNSLLIFGLAYLLIIKFIRGRLIDNSKRIVIANNNQVKIINEGIGSIRELILYRLQNIYLKKYSANDYPMRKWDAELIFFQSFSRYLIETLALLFISFITLSFYFINNDKSTLLPTLGVIALCIQRLLPGLQRSYSSLTYIKGVWESLKDIWELLKLPIDPSNFKVQNRQLSFKKGDSIIFKNVTYKYPSANKYIFKNFNLEIKIGSSLGIVGKTGEGKSTFLDLLMGLIEPNSGKLIISGKNLSSKKNLLFWRNSIAHVPQDIYLADITLAENIALCLDKKNIDFERLKYAAKIACINDFIMSTEKGYQTIVGERGILLSGGQKQRIGIARAIYKSAKVLILDEATSSLDNKTELAVINSIRESNKNLTLIMVAHNLRTLNNCERIIRLKGGQLADDGNADKILKEINN